MMDGELIPILTEEIIAGNKVQDDEDVVDNNTNVKLSLHKENLNALVEKTGDCPIHVISIVGHPKTGKTLVAGYFVRCLAAAEKDENNWMDWENPEKKQTEVQWKSGRSPSSPGIWAFPRPFMLTVEEGESTGKEVAVILLYAQLLEHDQRSSKTISTLLSHTSSVIYNSFKDLDGKSFSAISQGISVAPEHNSNSCPKLTFLLRDWRHPTNFAFGFQGGNSFLEDKLKISRRSTGTSDANRSREMIANYFQNKSCFLLPFPGDKVVSSGFSGSVSEMDLKFAKRLQEFVSELTNSDEISQILKNSEGKAFSGTEWKDGLIQYCEHYGTGKQNTPSRRSYSTLNLTSELSPTEQKEYLKRSMQKYSEVWKKRTRNTDFLPTADVENCHKRAKKAALQHLRQLFHSENESDEDDESTDMEAKLTKQLKKEIQKKLQEMENLNAENRKMFIQENMDESVEEFSKSLQQIFLGGESSIGEKAILQMSTKMITNAIENFRQIFASDDDDDENQDEAGDDDDQFRGATAPTTLLQQKLEQVRNNFLEKTVNRNNNALRQQENNKDFTTSKISSRETTSCSVSHGSREFEIDDSSDEEPKTEHPSTSSNNFNIETLTKQSNSPNLLHSRNTTTDVKSISIKADALISKYVEEYNSRLNSNGKKIDRQFHAENVEEYQQQFQSAFTSEGERSDLGRHLRKLINQLETTWSAANLRILRAEKKWQSNLDQEMEQICTTHEKELRNALSQDKSMNGVKLQKHHESLLKKQLKRLDDFEKQSTSSFKTSREGGELRLKLDELKLRLEKIHLKIETELDEKRQSELNQIKLIEEECLQNYKRSMNEILTAAITSVALKAEHQKYLNNAEETFEKKCKGKANASTTDLKQKIQETFCKLLKKHEVTNLSRRAEINETLIKSRQIYDEEMEKHFQNHEFITDKEIQKIHDKSSKKAIEKCQKEVGNNFGAEDLSDLKKYLNQAFIKFDEKNKMNLDVEPAVGIDLGTTYSCVAVYAKGQAKIIPNSIGKLTTPSYVAFSEDGRTLIGEPAKLRAFENPENTIFDAKRLIGRKFDDPKVQEDLKLWPFSVVNDRNIPKIEVNGKMLHPEEISARVLKQLKKDAEDFLKCKVTKAVITVPAYFSDGQRQATIDAGKVAGLNVLSVLNEPVAAAIAYNLQHSYGSGTRQSRNVMIFDLGGGTFDVAVLKINQGEVEVLAVEGDTHLGGEDFDKKTMAYCAEEFKKKEGIDLFQGKDSLNKLVRDDARRRLKRLQADCESKKIQLTNSRSAEVSVDSIHEKKDLSVKIRRATFEGFCESLFNETLAVVEKALKSGKLAKTEIDDIVLVGGSTRIPKIQQMLKEFFNGKELCSSINPDEAVAYGAAVQAAILNGKIAKGSKHFNKIMDVTPMSIGVEVYGGAFSVIIPKGIKIPVKAEERYRTAHNNQTSVQVTIYQGENMSKAVCNNHLGDFYLNGIPPKAAGLENIDVEMVISSQGILHVNAAVTSTGKTNKITVTENKQRMSRATIQRLLPEA